MKAQIKKQIKIELINLGCLEEGEYLDEEFTFNDLGLRAGELETLLLGIEDELGITFDSDIDSRDSIKILLGTSYS
jgi:hypothetical protein